MLAIAGCCCEGFAEPHTPFTELLLLPTEDDIPLDLVLLVLLLLFIIIDDGTELVAPLASELLIILLLLALMFFVAADDDPIADCGWPKYLWQFAVIMIELTVCSIILIHAGIYLAVG